jgi:hypothetical protein
MSKDSDTGPKKKKLVPQGFIVLNLLKLHMKHRYSYIFNDGPQSLLIVLIVEMSVYSESELESEPRCIILVEPWPQHDAAQALTLTFLETTRFKLLYILSFSFRFTIL